MNNFIRTPLLLLGATEVLILYSSFYVGAFILYGCIANCEHFNAISGQTVSHVSFQTKIGTRLNFKGLARQKAWLIIRFVRRLLIPVVT